MANDVLRKLWEWSLNIAIVLNKLKSLVLKIYKEGCTKKLNIENDQNIYFKAYLYKRL